jgi:hypothetical protein
MGSNRATVWAGRVISALVAFVFAMSAFMKVRGGEEVTQGMAHLGLPEAVTVPLAIVEISCLAVYLVPPTSVLGAVLLTGYLGGAVCAHLRVGDPVYTPIAIGALVWLGLYLREPRLRVLLPLRARFASP